MSAGVEQAHRMALRSWRHDRAAILIGAAALDLVQNLTLLAVLGGTATQPIPGIAWATAVIIIPVVLTSSAFALATARLRTTRS